MIITSLILTNCIVGVLSIELLIRLPLKNPIVEILSAALESIRVVKLENTSDKEKQAMLLANSFRTFKNTFLLFCLLSVFIFSISVVCSLAISMGLVHFDQISGWESLLILTGISMTYYFVRRRYE